MENLSVGQKATRSITLTAGHVKAYAEMTGPKSNAKLELLVNG